MGQATAPDSGTDNTFQSLLAAADDLALRARAAAGAGSAALFAEARARYQAALGLCAPAPAAGRERATVLNAWGQALAAQAALADKEEAEGLYKEALERYQAAIEADPQSPYPHHHRANALRALAQAGSREQARPLYEEAIGHYRAALGLCAAARDRAVVLNTWGLTLAAEAALADKEEAERLYQEAIGRYREAVEADAGNAYPHWNWGVALKALAQGKDYPQARPLCDEAIGHYRAALGLCAPAAAKDRSNLLNIWGLTLAGAAELAGREEAGRLYEEAVERYREAIEADAGNAYPHYNCGNALRSLAQSRGREPARPLYRRAYQHYQAASELYTRPADRSNALNDCGIALVQAAAQAGAAEAEGLYAEAQQRYREAIRADPRSPYPHWARGDALAALAGRKAREPARPLYQEAYGCYQAALDLCVRAADRLNVLVNWAVVLAAEAALDDGAAAERRYREALDRYRAAAQTDPGSFRPHWGLGDTRVTLAGRQSREQAQPLYEEAYRDYQAALDLCAGDKDRCKVLNAWGLALAGAAALAGKEEAERLYQEAIERYRAALAADADSPYPHWNWGIALGARAERRDRAQAHPLYVEAREHLQAAIERCATAADRANALSEWGRAVSGDVLTISSSSAGRLAEEAQVRFREAAAADPQQAAWHRFSAGNALLAARRYRDAIAEFAAAAAGAAQGPWPVYAHNNLAHAYFRQGKYEEGWEKWRAARTAYERYLEEVREQGEAPARGLRYYYGDLLYGLFRDLDAAEAVLESACGAEPQMTLCPVALAKLLYDRAATAPEQRPRAFAQVREARRLLAEGPDRPDVRERLLAELCLLVDDFDGARDHLQAALKEAGDSYELQALLGVAAVRRKEYREAIARFRGALLLDPDNLDCWSNLAEAHYKAEELDEAEVQYHKILSRAPGHIDSHIGLGEVYISMSERAEDPDLYEDAIHHFSEALVLSATWRGSKRLADRERAAVLYSRGYARVKLHEARPLLRRQNLLQAALADLESCVRSDPHHRRALRARGKLRESFESGWGRVGNWARAWAMGLVSLTVFLLAQVSFWLQPVLSARAGSAELTFNRISDAKVYIPLTFGSLLFLIAGLYLPQLLKLKVAGIELEKSPVDQISTPKAFTLKR